MLEELKEFRNKVKKIILDVLEQYKNANLHSESARETIAKEMMKEFGLEPTKITREDLVYQAYNEITSDGLPKGGDKEAMKLAQSMVDKLEEKHIYESPDGGKTIKKRKFEYKGGHLG